MEFGVQGLGCNVYGVEGLGLRFVHVGVWG